MSISTIYLDIIDTLSECERITLAILCAQSVCKDPVFNEWANKFNYNAKDRYREAYATRNYLYDKPIVMKTDKAIRNGYHAAASICLSVENLNNSYGSSSVMGTLIHASWVDKDIVPRMLVRCGHICPHCHKKSDQHTDSGKCLFGPYQWSA